MSIDQTNVVDFISTTPDGRIMLTIADHYSWEEPAHLQLLENKMNAYLSFIESGQIYDDYPYAKGRDLIIQLVMKYAPSVSGVELFEEIEKTINKAGINFQWFVYKKK
jgi:hypothetical protein